MKNNIIKFLDGTEMALQPNKLDQEFVELNTK